MSTGRASHDEYAGFIYHTSVWYDLEIHSHDYWFNESLVTSRDSAGEKADAAEMQGARRAFALDVRDSSVR